MSVASEPQIEEIGRLARSGPPEACPSSRDSFGPLIGRIDRTLGEWSYFAFLVHWLCGFVVVSTVLGAEQRGWLLLFAVTPLVLAACAGFAALNRRCLEPLRDWVRCGFG